MDILKRSLAPLTEDAWQEIEQRAGEVIQTHLSARRVINVNGPLGWDFSALPKGRLDLIEETPGEVCAGIYSVQPLVEARISFELNRWEMDNIIRGAKDVDLSPLENAAKKIALFEESAIYNGYPKGQIKGLIEVSKDTVSIGNEATQIMEAIAQGILKIKSAYAASPYTLIVGDEIWKRINMVVNGYPLKKGIEELLGTQILYTTALEGALLLPYNHDDLEFTLGQDFSIGYEHHDSKTVKLFITESFTFRVLDPNIVVYYTL